MGCDPEKLFPFKALKEQLQKSGFCAIIYASLVLPGVTLERVDFPDLDGLAEEINNGAKGADALENPRFVSRMRDVIEDVNQFGWI